MRNGTRVIYADHAATTPPAPEVVDAMLPWLETRFGNPSSIHGRGEAAREAVEQARAQVAELIGALPEEIVFAASGSEANNLALQGVLRAAASGNAQGRRRLVVGATEHNSVLATARHLESRGHPLSILAVDSEGVVDRDAAREALGPDVALVSVQWVNNETGVVQPVAEISALAHACGALVHCDAVQAAGKLPISVREAGVDLLSLAGHKFHGPLGAAALFVRRRVRLVPLIHGGHQERSRRAGTENLPALVGLGVAAQRAARRLEAGEPRRVALLGERLARDLMGAIPGARLNGGREHRFAGIVNLCIPGVDGEALLHELDREGISISTGSACSAAESGPSHVLTAMGLSPEDAHASVRFSLGEGIGEDDIKHLGLTIPPVVERLRALAGPAVSSGA